MSEQQRTIQCEACQIMLKTDEVIPQPRVKVSFVKDHFLLGKIETTVEYAQCPYCKATQGISMSSSSKKIL